MALLVPRVTTMRVVRLLSRSTANVHRKDKCRSLEDMDVVLGAEGPHRKSRLVRILFVLIRTRGFYCMATVLRRVHPAENDGLGKVLFMASGKWPILS
jgi:hypothetical protein